MEFRQDLEHKIDYVLGDMRSVAYDRSVNATVTTKLKNKVMDYLSAIGRNHRQKEAYVSRMNNRVVTTCNKVLTTTVKKISILYRNTMYAAR